MPNQTGMCALSAALFAECEPTAEAPAPMAARRRDTILLVEDHDVVAGLITKVLLQQGWRVVRARDGAACETEFAEHRARISLVVMDWRLPDTDGGALCQRLRALSPQLPVMLTSGRDHSGTVELLEHGGPTAFLPKPFRPHEVARSIATLVGTIA